MKITCQHHEQQAVLTLRGELTSEEVDQFRKEMLDQMHEKTHDFVLDMSQIQFIDSKGLESLLWLQDQCTERLGQVRLAACNDIVKTILRITRISDAIQSHDNVPNAIKSLQA
jgi:anti-sigma B factor antagonist